MKHALLSLLLAGCASVQTSVIADRLPDFDRMLGATVVFWSPSTGRTYCSGVIIMGHIWTASHCIEEEAGPRQASYIRYHDGRVDMATLLRNNSVEDWAELLPSRNVVGLSKAAKAPRIGENVWTVGHPQGLEWTLLRGYMAAEHRRLGGVDPNMHFWQLSLQVSAGNSGGPCIDANGEVFGLVSFVFTDGWDFTACADITGVVK